MDIDLQRRLRCYIVQGYWWLETCCIFSYFDLFRYETIGSGMERRFEVTAFVSFTKMHKWKHYKIDCFQRAMALWTCNWFKAWHQYFITTKEILCSPASSNQINRLIQNQRFQSWSLDIFNILTHGEGTYPIFWDIVRDILEVIGIALYLMFISQFMYLRSVLSRMKHHMITFE